MATCNTFVLSNPQKFGWSLDGCHDSDSDLTKTFQILQRIAPATTYLKITIIDGTRLLVEDVTAEALAASDKPPQYDTDLARYIDKALGGSHRGE